VPCGLWRLRLGSCMPSRSRAAFASTP